MKLSSIKIFPLLNLTAVNELLTVRVFEVTLPVMLVFKKLELPFTVNESSIIALSTILT